MAFRVVGALILTASIAVAACGGSSPEIQPASAAAPAADHAAHPGGGKVFFSEPKNGASVKSPVHIVFGSDMFTIAAVPPGEMRPRPFARTPVTFTLASIPTAWPPVR